MCRCQILVLYLRRTRKVRVHEATTTPLKGCWFLRAFIALYLPEKYWRSCNEKYVALFVSVSTFRLYLWSSSCCYCCCCWKTSMVSKPTKKLLSLQATCPSLHCASRRICIFVPFKVPTSSAFMFQSRHSLWPFHPRLVRCSGYALFARPPDMPSRVEGCPC